MRPPVLTGSLIDRTIAESSLALPIRAAVVALAVAVTAAAAQFTMPVPLTDVPFVLTPMAVLLAGAALGSRLGAVSQTLYLMAGMMGLAVFTPDPRLPAGALRLLGPTGGYLMAYPLAAWVTGLLAERGWDCRYVGAFAAMLAGLTVIYLGGVAWRLTLFRSLDVTIATSVLPFLVADVLKLAAAALILPQAWRLIGPRG